MANSLINEKVENSLNLIIKEFFWGNRLLDRIMTNLVIMFVMPKTESTLHIPLAHKYPLFSDELGGYMERRNCLVGYLDTPADMTVYNTPLEAFQKYLDYQVELEDLIQEAMNVAIDEGDIMTKKFLNNLLLEVGVYTNQALLLVDKAGMYGNDKFAWMMMDEHAESLLLPELQG